MKKLLIKRIGLGLACLFMIGESFAQVKVFFDEFKEKKVRISFRDSTYRTTLDETGVGIFYIPTPLAPGYAVLYGPLGINYFYLIPSMKQTISKQHNGRLSFSGGGKVINEYLNGHFLSTLNLNYKLDDNLFLKEWETLPNRLQVHLDTMPLPPRFKKLESKRLRYVAYNMLQAYPLYHSRLQNRSGYTPCNDYYQQLKNGLQEDSTAYELWEYRQFFKNAFQTLVIKESETHTPLELLNNTLHCVQEIVKDVRLKAYLIHNYMYEYVKHYGTEELETLLPIYKHNVTSPHLIAEFDELYQQHSQLGTGKKAPNFQLTDINGKKISLAQLAGRYVYIDVWATWCIPCCRELPSLQQLEKRYAHAPISFVSISIDNDKTAWENKVRKEQLGGIQLHAGPSSTFRKAYQISFIPKFILIDPESKIVDIKMTRPSDPQTVKTLDSLF